MKAYLEGRGLNYELAIANNWYPSYQAGDKFPRIVMPAVNKAGRAYWQARDMSGKAMKRYQSPGVPRGDSLIQTWPVGKCNYRSFVICEGPMDALAAAEVGLPGISLMGCNPTEDTFNYLVNMLEGVQDYAFVVTDRDAVNESIELVKGLVRFGIPALVLDPYPYKDLAAVPLDKRKIMFNVPYKMSKVKALDLTN